MGKRAWVVVIVVVLVVLGFGLWAWLMQDVNGDEEVDTDEEVTEIEEEVDADVDEEEAAVETDEVTFDGEAFEPQAITVSSGTTVRFVNESDGDFWPASDPHPQHTDLPEFDAQEGIEAGEVYEFTFEETGEWGYHDHLNSAITGTVIVE